MISQSQQYSNLIYHHHHHLRSAHKDRGSAAKREFEQPDQNSKKPSSKKRPKSPPRVCARARLENPNMNQKLVSCSILTDKTNQCLVMSPLSVMCGLQQRQRSQKKIESNRKRNANSPAPDTRVQPFPVLAFKEKKKKKKKIPSHLLPLRESSFFLCPKQTPKGKRKSARKGKENENESK